MHADPAGDWSRYWRSPDEPLEAMHAHFTGHVYHRHSHDTYSFGVTEAGAQSFTCRQAGHTSTAGMVMAFNPDDPHDGHATTGAGFRYRMIHIGPGLVTDALSDISGRPAGRPLFTRPVVDDPALARALRRLHRALTGQASPLECSERLSAAVALATRFAASGPPDPAALTGPDVARTAQRVREFLDGNYAAPVTGADLAASAGRSRYAAYRAFHAVHGLAPSDYQRQLRLRAVRQWLAQGMPLAEAAAAAGFADQAHLT
ncbi:MAG TPA: AraC family transcriptional regulator, partial [Streptosporangiaceae bacterium]|nr:AraC family transcriptional regulator [Streptosporangiaceae bacterium]